MFAAPVLSFLPEYLVGGGTDAVCNHVCGSHVSFCVVINHFIKDLKITSDFLDKK